MKVKTIIAILISMLTMTSCSSRVRIEQPPQAVQAQRIGSQSSASAGGLRFSAVVTPDSQVPLAFRIPGYVISLKQVRGQDGRMRDIAEGDRVSAGAVLAQIRSTEYQDKVHQNDFQVKAEEAAAEKAKLDFDRASRLFASDSITKPEFDAARAQYDSTQAKVRAAQAQTAS